MKFNKNIIFFVVLIFVIIFLFFLIRREKKGLQDFIISIIERIKSFFKKEEPEKPQGKVLPSAHTECQNGTCVLLQGEGKNICQFDRHCQLEFHTECKKQGDSFKCVQVQGIGIDQCTLESDEDCAQGVPVYKQCIKGKCLEFFGKGIDGCNIDNDCWIPE